MKILVLGGSGMLGHKLVQRWQDKFDVWATLRGSFSQYDTVQDIEIAVLSLIAQRSSRGPLGPLA
jgi:nucleoside-diphosphate-sugar epimerase